MGFGVVDPYPLATAGEPQILPWANNPIAPNIEPPGTQIDTGWNPAPDAPDFRIENFVRNAQAELNRRGIQCALFVEQANATVTIAGAQGVGNNRRITINGHNIDDNGANLDTATIVAARFVAAINADAAVNTKVFATSSAGVVSLEGLVPGLVFTLAVAVLAGAGTITVTLAPVQPIIRVDWSGTGNPDDPGQMDLVIGSLKADDYGGTIGDKRIIWRKAKASFRAGEFTGVLGDNATTGANSIGLGLDAQGIGARSFAAGGPGSIATGADAIGLGGGNATNAADIAIGLNSAADSTASTEALAVGNGAAARAGQATAIGGTSTASALGSTAVGRGASASGAESLALGLAPSASAQAAVAIGWTAAATFHDAIAIGDGAQATTAQGAIAIGTGVVTTGKGGFGSGITSGGNLVQASGLGSRAHGAPHLTNGVDGSDVIASGEGAAAHGDDTLASGAFSRATGAGAVAANRGEVAHSALSNATNASNFQGQHQKSELVLQANTADDTTLIKFCTDKTDGTGTEFVPTDNRGFVLHYEVVITKPTTADTAIWAGTIMGNKLTGAVVLTAGFDIAGAAVAIAAALAPNVATGVFNAGASRLKISASTTKVRFEINGEAATDGRACLHLRVVQSGNVI